MIPPRSLITLTEEQTIVWYQQHIQVLHGYALALSLKAGLSPAEAATFFVTLWHEDYASLQSQATPTMLEQQARQIAEVLALTYGDACLALEREGENWLVKVDLALHEPLERYGVSLEYYIQWVAHQLHLVCEAKGILCTVWLEGESQLIRLALQEDM